MLYLKTKRIQLRQVIESDLELHMDLNSDPEVMLYLNGGVPAPVKETQAGLERALHYQKLFGFKLGVFTAEIVGTKEFIGWFLLRPHKKDLGNLKDLELGYRLKKQFWGLGYATEVSRALIEKAFSELGADSVFAQTLATNQRSRKVMEKVGMKFEKEFIDEDYPRLGPAVMYRLRNPN